MEDAKSLKSPERQDSILAIQFVRLKNVLTIHEYLETHDEDSLVGKYFIVTNKVRSEDQCFLIDLNLLKDRRFMDDSYFQFHHRLRVGELS